MHIKNTTTHFGLIAIILHWIIAFLIILLLALGLYMVDLPIGSEKLKLYGWHKEYGFLILLLVLIRIYWRLINITPDLAIPWWEKVAARSVHWIFYFIMLALPITGWLMTSAAGLPFSFFGLFTLPDLISPNAELQKTLQTIHQWLAYGMIALITLHVAAALKHHFINKDNILRRMIS